MVIYPNSVFSSVSVVDKATWKKASKFLSIFKNPGFSFSLSVGDEVCVWGGVTEVSQSGQRRVNKRNS